jgi:hypothetical protein
MKSSMASFKKLILLGFVSFAGLAQSQLCNLWQVCENHGSLEAGTFPTDGCADPHTITIPVFVEGGYAPQVMSNYGTSNLASACPFYDDPTEALCCNSDTAAIMDLSFQQIDGVFATDCPVCAANLKRFWCEYACSPTRGEFCK